MIRKAVKRFRYKEIKSASKAVKNKKGMTREQRRKAVTKKIGDRRHVVIGVGLVANGASLLPKKREK